MTRFLHGTSFRRARVDVSGVVRVWFQTGDVGEMLSRRARTLAQKPLGTSLRFWNADNTGRTGQLPELAASGVVRLVRLCPRSKSLGLKSARWSRPAR